MSLKKKIVSDLDGIEPPPSNRQLVALPMCEGSFIIDI